MLTHTIFHCKKYSRLGRQINRYLNNKTFIYIVLVKFQNFVILDVADKINSKLNTTPSLFSHLPLNCMFNCWKSNPCFLSIIFNLSNTNNNSKTEQSLF